MRSLILLSFLLLVACRPGVFSDFEDQTPVRTVSGPSSFPVATFGTVLTTYTGDVEGVPFSRLVVSTGDYLLEDGVTHSSVWAVYGGWNGARLDLGETISVNCNTSSDMCAPGEGASLAPLRSFLGETGCVMAGAPSANEVRVTCESSDTLVPFNAAMPGERFGASVVGVPATSPFALAFIGAPGARRVALVRDDNDRFPGNLDLGGVYAPADDAEFGASLALATLPPTFRGELEGELLLVIGEPGTSRVVFTVIGTDPNAGGSLVTEVLGCVDRPASPRFGSVLAAGDLTGDGIPEILMGAELAVVDRADEIVVVSADQLIARQGCADETELDDLVAVATQVIACDANGLLDGNPCAGSGFGSAFAIGNIDGAGANELLVGLPLADSDMVSHAGIALVFPTAVSIDDLVKAETLLVLKDSSPSVNDTLGYAVAFLPTQLGEGMTRRDEPVVSAPGANTVFTYLCTGLPGDALGDGIPRCLVEQ